MATPGPVFLATLEGEEGHAEDCDKLIEVLEVLSRRRKAKLLAWARFCERVGIPADQPREAFGVAASPVFELVEEVLRRQLGEIEVAPEEVSEELAPLLRMWQR